MRGTYNRRWGEIALDFFFPRARDIALCADEEPLALRLLRIILAGTIYASGGDTRNLTAVTFHNGSVHTLGTRKACPAEAYYLSGDRIRGSWRS